MSAILICPAERAAVRELAPGAPLALVPIYGRSILVHWIEALAAQGVKELTILAADRPHRIREHVGDGRRWGVQLEVVPVPHEPTPDEARTRLRPRPAAPASVPECIVIDHLPGQPARPLFESYAGWFAAVREWMPRAVNSGRIGVHEIRPGIWAGLRADIAPGATIRAPCWIGDHVRVGRRAVLGPNAVVDDRAVIDEGASVADSIVGSDTYVGRFISVGHSLAQGTLLIDWSNGSSVEVPDAILLANLAARRQLPRPTHWIGRLSAAVIMLATLPFALAAVLLSVLRNEAPWHLRLGSRADRGPRTSAFATFAYYELGAGQNWLRRWPQFWSVLRGDVAWFGNRPLRPTEALQLTNDFERLWLAAPVGLISLADAYGCQEGVTDESIAHASYYAVHAGARLHWFIFSRSFFRAALAWPVRGQRRKEAAVPLQDLVPKQEL